MKQFEYKTLNIEPSGKWIKTVNLDATELEAQLNEMGNNGWELVNSMDHLLDGKTIKVIMFFKREIIKPNS